MNSAGKHDGTINSDGRGGHIFLRAECEKEPCAVRREKMAINELRTQITADHFYEPPHNRRETRNCYENSKNPVCKVYGDNEKVHWF